MSFTTARARELRQRQTPTECLLWEEIRDRRMLGLKFRRQHSFQGMRFIADFCCPSLRFIIEIDGAYHETSEQKLRDHDREVLIRELGYVFLRVTADDVINKLPDVLQKISIAITNKRLDNAPSALLQIPPLPSEGEGAGG